MIIDLPDTTTQALSKKLRDVREEWGELTIGRVLTLIVVASGEDDIDAILDTLHDASREHPSRVILLVSHGDADNNTLDCQIRMGGDAGASEVIVMHLHGALAKHCASVVTPLLLPDTPIVAWWPGKAPRNPAADPIGAIAQRRITDACVEGDPDPFYRRRLTYSPGDTDLVWSRITLWRAVLASMVDRPPHEEILSAEVHGPALDPSVDIAAGWLADRLDVPVSRITTDADAIPCDDHGEMTLGIQKTVLYRPSGESIVEIVDASTASLTVAGKTSLVTLSRRVLADCLAEELRHLDPDETYGRALRRLVRVHRPGHSMNRAAAAGVPASDTTDDFEGSHR
ncbi:glucose-6-phosphate dehydrogenase assembly protein OpcA [Corynebacterium sp. 320]|uniref:glucose-6-phosphate dehydrogenase assembly protein OpcA n=1 Tax=Corynebacterium TaxID=1716 RepID=UPI00125CC21A|nr:MULTISPECIES: glucose-6-phosphate dehydrogenase assembly protein OpcA [Corynebacterium]KAB1503673.1 glucose-6-phosphate dehydrogenase assembly protein OpcA [Corynebacterium sp. 320]KAB1553226.1 glucose-6-phosphate dehydrogenase assembly protein OpcA [Corynebacterium sp. 321]KAB1553555.1 glucose-6-phosphate dehydrogenase assembly protein OpcA [Corynebacterium sp. 319]KAB3527809.1 glucose-6-phosphate dehydrogenase assembly protein OpcA [Corynebacterium sp. 250]KAB3540702.1 glucose-6-phosphate